MKKLLSKKHVEKRFTWAKENLDRDWDKVIFLDESSFSYLRAQSSTLRTQIRAQSRTLRT